MTQTSLGPVLLAVALTLSASTSHAVVVEEGDICTLGKELRVRYQTNRGWALLPVKEGLEIDVVTVGEEGVIVRAGRIQGLVDRGVLDSSCKTSAGRCEVLETFEIEENPDGTGRLWRLKPGAILQILETQKASAKVRYRSVTGYLGTSLPETACSRLRARYRGDNVKLTSPEILAETAPKPVVRAGARVLFAPFTLGPGLTSAQASLFEDKLAGVLRRDRGDVSGPGDRRPSTAQRQQGLKAHLKRLKPIAKESGVTHVLTGQLTRPGYKAPAKGREVTVDSDEDIAAPVPSDAVLLLAVLDVKSGKVVKTIRVNPKLDKDYVWAEPAVSALTGALPAP